MKPLYEIATEFKELLNEITDAEEFNDEHMEMLNQCREDLDKKIINIVSYIKNLESENEAIEKAIVSMNDRNKRLNKKIEKLKDYVKNNMESLQIKEVKSPYFDVRIKYNPPSVNIKNEGIIPAEYFKEFIFVKIDKNLISEHLKQNISIPGTYLEKKTRLEIR